ncbi:hypothetical protein E4T80_12525 [Muribacter muris]|uniref:Ubiquinol-cytochrome c chaperone domain-containing protein n=1 Tax=Muribacter muris TaxID=67855 RepID=A0A4Y9JN50_9PAST|nr:ubiquinol-cytochrome C chaperone family protein [Muribacter muris]MBF0786284.1 hypothetical protein [Muribacter muris]TFV07213.1 hypothetical protein E4T80_12525 [Muribacter muris]
MRYHPDHQKYWKEIAEELQLFGGNTFMNLIKGGKGVLYKEVLCDVCDKMKVNYNKSSSVKRIEENLLMKILQTTLEKMTPEELKKLAIEMGLKNVEEFNPQKITAAFIYMFNLGGFTSYKITLIIVNAVMRALFGHGLKLAANAALARWVSILTGPVGVAITSIWTLIDIAGPAYRVTIPAVIQIAYLRSLSEFRDEIEQEQGWELKL